MIWGFWFRERPSGREFPEEGRGDKEIVRSEYEEPSCNILKVLKEVTKTQLTCSTCQFSVAHTNDVSDKKKPDRLNQAAFRQIYAIGFGSFLRLPPLRCPPPERRTPTTSVVVLMSRRVFLLPRRLPGRRLFPAAIMMHSTFLLSHCPDTKVIPYAYIGYRSGGSWTR
jgi:hypothetical protein